MSFYSSYHVVATKSRLAVRQVGIEDITAQSSTRRAAQAMQEAVVGKLFFEGECAQVDLLLDCFQPLPSSTKVGF
jgi:hypothetical protein